MKKFFEILCAAVFVFLLSFTETFAENADSSRREAVCSITSGGEEYAADDCIVSQNLNENNIWLVLERKNGEPLLEEILSVTIYVINPKTVMVTGLTKNGNNSRWGEAVRQKDCYTGSDFRICIKNKK